VKKSTTFTQFDHSYELFFDYETDDLDTEEERFIVDLTLTKDSVPLQLVDGILELQFLDFVKINLNGCPVILDKAYEYLDHEIASERFALREADLEDQRSAL